MPTPIPTSERIVERWLTQKSTYILGAVIAVVFGFTAASLLADDTTTRYFEQLRQRGLFDLAESEAASRLADGKQDFETQVGMTIELSRTLTEHAGYLPEEQRNELWQRAVDVVGKLAAENPSHPRSLLLIEQLGAVPMMQADWLCAERDVRQFDDQLAIAARTASGLAIRRLSELEASLNESAPDSTAKKTSAGPTLSAYERRQLSHRTRWMLAKAYRTRAELFEPASTARRNDLAEAEQIAKRLVETADEPLRTQSRLILVSCPAVEKRAVEGHGYA